MQPLALVFVGAMTLLVVAIGLVLLRAVLRARRGEAQADRRGWQRLPDGSDVCAGWRGWPFDKAYEPGTASDVLTGELHGVPFVSLQWTQLEGHPDGARHRAEHATYNIVGLAVDHELPPLAVVRGRSWSFPADQFSPGVVDVETGDGAFDRRWQVAGDEAFARALLGPEVRRAITEIDEGLGWSFQPGWVTRVTPWLFWSGEDAMVAELHRAAAPWRHVPAEAWAAYGGQPRFATVLGEGPAGDESPVTGPGRGWD